MKVGINARHLGKNLQEFGQYIYYILSYLGDIDKENNYILFVPKPIDNIDIKKEFGENFRLLVVSERFKFIGKDFSRIWWEQIKLPKAAKKEAVDLVYYPYPQAPYFNRKLTYTTTCTSAFLWELNKRKKKYSGSYLIRAFRKASKIITPSVAAKFDAIDLFDKEEKDIFVVYSGKTSSSKKGVDIKNMEVVKKRYNLQKPFIFYIDGFKHYQNVDRLIEAFAKLKNKFDIDLVLGGDTGAAGSLLYQDFEKVASKVSDSGIKDNVKFVGLLPVSDLITLYNLSSVFVYVSFLGNFSLSIIEAMACQTAVVVSKAPEFMEIVEGKGMLVDPFSSEDIAEGIGKILSDNILREKLEKEGVEQAQKFSWNITAGKILQIFKQIAK